MTTVIACGANENEARLATMAGALSDACVARYDAHGLGGTISIAQALPYFTAVYVQQKPSLVIVIGDGPEMLAAALAALFLKINVTHLGGDHEEIGDFGNFMRECIAHISGASWYENKIASNA